MANVSMDISDLKAAYSGGNLTPLGVIHNLYDRIEAYSDKAVWIALVPREEAVAQTQALQTKYEGKEKPALYGIPFSVKDSIDIQGFETTLACKTFSGGKKATRTAPVVQRILDAGGILVGKTNLDQFATGLVGHRSPYGTPRCVVYSEYISGGSSSGAVVSVAANLVSFAVGTDTAGSTRVPAALNGVVGWKPTIGTLSTIGLVPAVQTADCITVLARTVPDATAAWDVMRGFDEEDIYARRTPQTWPWLWPEGNTEKPVRFGVPPDHLLEEALSPEYAELFQTALTTLTKLPGWKRSSNLDYTPFQSANDMLYGSSIVAQRLVAFDDYLQTHGLDDLHPAIQAIFGASMAAAPATGVTTNTSAAHPYAAAWDAVRAYKDLFSLQADRRAAEQQFRDSIDVLVVPSTATHFTLAEIDADPLGRNRRLGSFTHFVNLLDLCAVAVPTGTWKNKNGNAMPFGITLIAQAGRDKELLQLAEQVMKTFHCKLSE